MSWRDDLALFGITIPVDLSPDEWVQSLKEKPCRNSFMLVGLAAALFYAAEKGNNPKVNEIWDATVYCSTCLSVGYGDIFARTPVGKIIGTILMTIGPAMANHALDGPHPRHEAAQNDILATLKQILEQLRQDPPT